MQEKLENIYFWDISHLRCSANHIRHKTFVTGCIQHCEMLALSFEKTTSNLDCFAFFAFCKKNVPMILIFIHLSYLKNQLGVEFNSNLPNSDK